MKSKTGSHKGPKKAPLRFKPTAQAKAAAAQFQRQ